MFGVADYIQRARRLARKNFFRGRREYVLVGCGKNIPVFHAPGKSFCDRSVAGLAAGVFALLLLAVSGGGFAARAGQPGITLDQLMKSLSQRKHGKVTYQEEDYLGILERPVKSSGVLVYDAPDHLEKRTLKPKQESLVLEGDQLTVRRGRRTYQVQLSSYPQLAPFVDAVRETLAGDEDGLQKVFKVGLTGSLEDWKLQLVPLDKKVARKVRRVEIGGVRDEVRSVEILQVDGDRSVMTLGSPADESGDSR